MNKSHTKTMMISLGGCLSAMLGTACTSTVAEDTAPDEVASTTGGSSAGEQGTTMPPGGTTTPPPGGSSGGGASVMPARLSCGIAQGADGLIDDFEDGDLLSREADERNGNWFSSSDAGEYSTFGGETDADRGGVFHMVTPELAGEWGGTAAVGFGGQCYNASPYTGVSLWAKGEGSFYLELRLSETTPVGVGGHCEDFADDPSKCASSNFHAVKIDLTETWTKYTFAWDDFEQAPGFGVQVPVNIQELEGISFRTVGPDVGYDVFLDDLAFETGDLGMGGATAM